MGPETQRTRPETQRIRPVTEGTGRLEAFSDAVMAVVITILALGLRRLSGTDWSSRSACVGRAERTGPRSWTRPTAC